MERPPAHLRAGPAALAAAKAQPEERREDNVIVTAACGFVLGSAAARHGCPATIQHNAEKALRSV
jgi:hypothetical protein